MIMIFTHISKRRFSKYNLCFFPVFESFKDYVATEQLDGDNKYDAGEHGLQVKYFCNLLALVAFMLLVLKQSGLKF